MKYLSFFLLTAAASAQIVPFLPNGGPSIQTFGSVGIAEGQTARLNALNPGVQAPAATGIMCSALVSFLDDQGTSLKSETLTVAPGKTLSFDLDADTDLKLATNQRKQIRATIQIPPAATTTPAPFCTIVPTLEIFDRITGKTQLILVETRPIPQVITNAARP